MGSVLWPRLGPVSQRQILTEFRRSAIEDLRGGSATSHYDIVWYPTGPRADDNLIQGVRASIRSCAERHGWPDMAVGDTARRQFDQELSNVLGSEMQMIPADAAHPSVWAFLTLIVAPDAARWRYPDNNDERYIGRTDRNTFGRLWWRHHRVGPIGAALLEDQAVAIIERPSIGGRSRLATALATAIARHPDGNQDLMRHAAKRIRRDLAVIEIGALSNEDIESVVQAALSFAESEV